jgi:dolichol-phosphate mannosyltransferase
MQMLMTGVLGEYLWRALDEARRRPPYLIEEALGGLDARDGREVSVQTSFPSEDQR